MTLGVGAAAPEVGIGESAHHGVFFDLAVDITEGPGPGFLDFAGPKTHQPTGIEAVGGGVVDIVEHDRDRGFIDMMGKFDKSFQKLIVIGVNIGIGSVVIFIDIGDNRLYGVAHIIAIVKRQETLGVDIIEETGAERDTRFLIINIIFENALAGAKQDLLAAGFEADAIKIKMEAKKKGIAQDIAAEAQTGYDVVVLGRRGISGIKEFFLGSISQKVINAVKNVSVVFVD